MVVAAPGIQSPVSVSSAFPVLAHVNSTLRMLDLSQYESVELLVVALVLFLLLF